MHPAHPYAPPQYQGPNPGAPRRKSSLPVWLFIIGGGGLLVIGGLIAVVVWGISLVEDEVSVVLSKHPVVVGALGTVKKCSMNVGASAADPRTDYFHYQCEGSKASGRAIVHTEPTGPGGDEQLVDGKLVLSDGKTIPLKP